MTDDNGSISPKIVTRMTAIANLTFPKNAGIVPIFRNDGVATFAKAPCAWSVYKAQMLEFYYYFMRSRKIGPVRFFMEEVGSVDLPRDLVRSLLEDCIAREFLDTDPEAIE